MFLSRSGSAEALNSVKLSLNISRLNRYKRPHLEISTDTIHLEARCLIPARAETQPLGRAACADATQISLTWEEDVGFPRVALVIPKILVAFTRGSRQWFTARNGGWVLQRAVPHAKVHFPPTVRRHSVCKQYMLYQSSS